LIVGADVVGAGAGSGADSCLLRAMGMVEMVVNGAKQKTETRFWWRVPFSHTFDDVVVISKVWRDGHDIINDRTR
jgi:hypothetical protein